jgi:hypothetical protein
MAGRIIKTPAVRYPKDTDVTEDDDEEEEEEEQEPEPVLPLPLAQRDDFIAPEPPAALASTEPVDPDTIVHKTVEGWSTRTLVTIQMEQLRWDVHCKWGQIRVINESLVERYKIGLLSNPPRFPIRILVRSLGRGMP